MGKHLLRLTARTLLFVIRHAPALAAALCLALSAQRYLESRARLTLYERVQEQQRAVCSMHDMPGTTVLLHGELSMFLPAGWEAVSSADTQHPAYVAAYQGRDALGRRMTLTITRSDQPQPWNYNEEGALYFARWFAGREETRYRVFVSAENAFCASSSSLCRALLCMLRSIRAVTP